MTALYPSTSAAQVFVPAPLLLSTTGASAPIDPTYANCGDYPNISLVVSDPSGAVIVNAALNALPAGCTAVETIFGFGVVVTLATSLFTTAGQYAFNLGYTLVANYQSQTANLQWGGWVDALIGKVDSIDASTTGTVQILSNRIDVDDPNAPTTITVYQSDDVTPLRTRTIANADGSPVNPAQILRLGRYV